MDAGHDGRRRRARADADPRDAPAQRRLGRRGGSAAPFRGQVRERAAEAQVLGPARQLDVAHVHAREPVERRRHVAPREHLAVDPNSTPIFSASRPVSTSSFVRLMLS